MLQPSVNNVSDNFKARVRVSWYVWRLSGIKVDGSCMVEEHKRIE